MPPALVLLDNEQGFAIDQHNHLHQSVQKPKRTDAHGAHGHLHHLAI
jgi:hypothetical protein